MKSRFISILYFNIYFLDNKEEWILVHTYIDPIVSVRRNETYLRMQWARINISTFHRNYILYTIILHHETKVT